MPDQLHRAQQVDLPLRHRSRRVEIGASAQLPALPVVSRRVVDVRVNVFGDAHLPDGVVPPMLRPALGVTVGGEHPLDRLPDQRNDEAVGELALEPEGKLEVAGQQSPPGDFVVGEAQELLLEFLRRSLVAQRVRAAEPLRHAVVQRHPARLLDVDEQDVHARRDIRVERLSRIGTRSHARIPDGRRRGRTRGIRSCRRSAAQEAVIRCRRRKNRRRCPDITAGPGMPSEPKCSVYPACRANRGSGGHGIRVQASHGTESARSRRWAERASNIPAPLARFRYHSNADVRYRTVRRPATCYAVVRALRCPVQPGGSDPMRRPLRHEDSFHAL